MKTPGSLSKASQAQIRNLIIEHVQDRERGGGGTKDIREWVFEAAMEGVYGSKVWEWYNKLPGDER